MNVKSDATAEVSALLEILHSSAARGELQAYFNCFFLDSVFVGTDVREYWKFPDYARVCTARFREGKNWTFTTLERNVHFPSEDNVAWFYERLISKRDGEVRGSGMVIKRVGNWKVSLYVLSFPVPNELTDSFVEQVRAHKKK